ncbi:MAG: hypothetical protein CMN31_19470 [Sandaracinus sp.]|nr:hypothetical protein [Sandaracinus sp.]
MRSFPTAALVALALAAPAAPAAAQSSNPRCFGGDAVRAAPLTLGEPVAVGGVCEYARDPDGPYRPLNDRSSITALLDGLGWTGEGSTTVYGRRRDTPEEVASVFVDHCTDYLLQPGGAFAVGPGDAPGTLRVRRASSRCGAAALSLRFQCLASSGPGERSLAAGATTLELPECTSGWVVEARAGDAPPYPLGRVQAGGETPLQAWFGRGDAPPLFQPDWQGEQGLRFRATGDDDLWAELRTAFAAGAARLVRLQGATARSACAGEGEEVPVVVTGSGLAFDEGWLAGEMRGAYGEDGLRVAPGLGRLKALADGLHLCLAPSYGVRGAQQARGQSFAQVARTAELAERFESAELCLDHARVRVTPGGTTSEPGERQCVSVAADAAPPVLAAVVGATVSVPEGALLCNGREDVEASEAGYTPGRGFYDVRVATRGGCRTLQAASLARLAVVDPAIDWIPAGVERDDPEEGEGPLAWRGIPVDDPQTFARVRRRDALRFRMTTPEGFASAWNHPGQGAPTAVSQFAPVVTGEPGEYGHARPPAFSTRITTEEACPLVQATGVEEGEEGEEQAEGPELLGSQDALVDQRVFTHLVLDDGRQPRCVAVAAFRAWEPRVVANVGRSERRQFRLGLLGDARVGVFFSKPEPGAIGVAWPLLYADLHLNAGFVFEASIPVSAAISWEDGGGSRVGPALMLAMNWGWPEVAPRLLTFAFLINTPWPNDQDEIWSFFAGVNLSSLIDLLGGR